MAYLFAHFTGEEKDGEQVYFSGSRDGLNWTDLNGGKPVLRSGKGTKGVRDPFPVRDPKGSSFYLIATDLRIEAGKGWEAAACEGSLNLVVWESKDLVTWSEERLCPMEVPDAGCVWAPEAVYDWENGRFFVFFACNTKAGEGRKQRIYGTFTKDFVTFSDPFLYMEREEDVIDTTIFFEWGTYFRFSKDEKKGTIILEKSQQIDGNYERIESDLLNRLTGVEGPEAYLLPGGKTVCLIVDRFAEGKGYLPLLTEDLSGGNFRIPEESEYSFGKTKKRHGGVLPVNDSEYARVTGAYPEMKGENDCEK